MRYTTLLTLAAAAVSAQSIADQTYDSSLNMTIDANAVDASTKATWCRAQLNSCDTLCADDASQNECDYDTIKYDCECASNSSAPGLQFYTQTMPTFICQTLTDQCIVANAQNQTGTDECRKNIQSHCGKLDPNKADVSSEESSTASTETGAASTASATATGTKEQASTTSATDAGDFAAATAVPILAALGIVAALV